MNISWDIQPSIPQWVCLKTGDQKKTTQNEQFIVGFWSFRRNVQTNPDWESGRVYKDVGNPGSTDTLQAVSIRIMWVLVTQPRIQFELLWDRYTKSKVLKGAFLNKNPDQPMFSCAENPSEFIEFHQNPMEIQSSNKIRSDPDPKTS